MRKVRRTVVLTTLVLVVAAGVGHWAFWYRPRLRPMPPGDAEILPEVTEAGGWGLWVPFPHQNLPALESHLGGDPRLARGAARLLGLDDAAVRWLETDFPVPWASEMAISVEPVGGVGAAVRFFPVPGTAIRLLGGLAGNPWLAGGEVSTGDGRTEVAWKGRVWSFGPWAGGVSSEGAEPALASLFLTDPPSPFGAGRYDLRLDGRGDVVLTRGRPPVSDWDGPSGAVIALARVNRNGDREVVLLLRRPETGAVSGELPALTAWTDGGDPRELIPGGSGLGSLVELPLRDLSGGRLAAVDRWSLGRGGELVPRMLASLGDAPFRLWVGVPGAADLLDRLVGVLEDVPVVSADDLEVWKGARDVVVSLGEIDVISGRVERDGAAEVRLRRP